MRASELEMRAESPAVAYAAASFEDVVNASLAAGACARQAKVACTTGGLDYICACCGVARRSAHI